MRKNNPALPRSALAAFFTGLGSVLNIYPAPLVRPPRPPRPSDAEAVRGDWQRVQQDFAKPRR